MTANTHNEIHFFATHALGYATSAKSREDAIERLLLRNTDPTWVRNCLKDGNPLVLYTCQVNLPQDAGYRIMSYQPVADTQDGENYLVTYLTKTQHAVIRDPSDEVQKLEAEREDLLQHIYLDWVNNYLTVGRYADDHNITVDKAEALIEAGREVHSQRTDGAEPEAEVQKLQAELQNLKA